MLSKIPAEPALHVADEPGSEVGGHGIDDSLGGRQQPLDHVTLELQVPVIVHEP